MEFELNIEDQVQRFGDWKSTVENKFSHRFGQLGQEFLRSGAREFENGSSVTDLIYISSIPYLPYHLTMLVASCLQNPMLFYFIFIFSFFFSFHLIVFYI